MKQAKTVFRRIASNEVLTPQGQCLSQQVMELTDGVVTNLYPLVQELSNTEWMQGQIVLKSCPNNIVHAYYKGKKLT